MIYITETTFLFERLSRLSPMLQLPCWHHFHRQNHLPLHNRSPLTCAIMKDQKITPVCDEIVFFEESVVSYVFRYADFGTKTQKILARTVFRQMENFCMERVKPGCFINK